MYYKHSISEYFSLNGSPSTNPLLHYSNHQLPWTNHRVPAPAFIHRHESIRCRTEEQANHSVLPQLGSLLNGNIDNVQRDNREGLAYLDSHFPCSQLVVFHSPNYQFSILRTSQAVSFPILRSHTLGRNSAPL